MKLIWNMTLEPLLTLQRPILPTFKIMCYIHYSLFVQCLLMDWKYQTLTKTMLTKVSLRPSSHIITMQKIHGWTVRAILTRKTREMLSTAEVKRRKLLLRQSAECTLYGKNAVDFFICQRHLLSCVTLRIAFRRSIDDFVIVSDDAVKQYKVILPKLIGMCGRRHLMTLLCPRLKKHYWVVLPPILTLKHLQKRFWLQRFYKVGNKKIYLRENQSADWRSA